MRYIFLLATLASATVFAGERSDDSLLISWQSCDNGSFHAWFGGEDIPERLQCGYLSAPLDYDVPNGKKVKLAVTRLPAIGESKGSVISVTGGPGMSGILVPFDTEKLNQSYDIIGYDPRGVGYSSPRISCARLPEDEESGDDAEKSVDELDAENKKWVESCISQTTPDVLKHIGTNEAVTDVDTIRLALGADKINIISYSYGTQVAAIYAERFPEKLRAVVLDGVVDIADSAFNINYKQSLAFQRAFDRFSNYCEYEGVCPLSKKNAVNQYHSLLASINEQSLVDKTGREINSDNIIKATTNAFYSSAKWAVLARLLSSIDNGPFDYDALQTLETFSTDDISSIKIRASTGEPGSVSKGHKESNEENVLYTESINMTVINCVDIADPDISQKKSRENENKIANASSYNNYPPGRSLPRDQCDFFPFKGKMVPHTPIVSTVLPPMLFVAQRFDPATPYENAQNMLKYFPGYLITVEGDGHTLALAGVNQCVDNAVIKYFLDPHDLNENINCQK